MLITWNSAGACGSPLGHCRSLTRRRRPSADTRERYRWQPWIGCWWPRRRGSSTSRRRSRSRYAWFRRPGTSAVDVVTVSGSQIVSRERHRCERRAPSAASATAAPDGKAPVVVRHASCLPPVRIRMRSGGVKRGNYRPDGHGRQRRLARHRRRRHARQRRRPRPASSRPPAAGDAAAPTSRRPSPAARVPTPSLRTLLPIGDAEIIDAATMSARAVVEAWLAETRQQFTMNASASAQPANAGVDGRVIDMLVALSYPKAFAIKPSATLLGELATRGGGGETEFLGASPLLVGGSILDACGPYYAGFSLWVGRLLALYGFYGSRYGFGPYDYLCGLAAGTWRAGRRDHRGHRRAAAGARPGRQRPRVLDRRRRFRIEASSGSSGSSSSGSSGRRRRRWRRRFELELRRRADGGTSLERLSAERSSASRAHSSRLRGFVLALTV